MLEFASGVEGVLRHDYFQLFCKYKKSLNVTTVFYTYRKNALSLCVAVHGQLGFFANVSRLK